MVHKHINKMYWCWYNYQIKLTSKAKGGIDFVLCYTVLLNFPSNYIIITFAKLVFENNGWLKCGISLANIHY